MADRDLNRVERLARRICKSLERGTTIEGPELYNRIASADRQPLQVSPVWRQEVRADAEDMPKAVELAQARGWLAEQDGRYFITPAGVELSKRSRVGHRKARLGLYT